MTVDWIPNGCIPVLALATLMWTTVAAAQGTILGACNPQFAYQALQSEDKIGAMLPCNVVVQQTNDGRVEVSAVDLVASMWAMENL